MTTILPQYATACALLVLLGAALLSGCANELLVDEDEVPAYGAQARPLEEPLAAEYRVRPGDKIAVKFFHAPELNEELTVRSDGRISMQLVGDMPAAGRTPAELAAEVSRTYADTLIDPATTVIVRESTARVYVGGEIAKPAFVKLEGDLTVLQAIFSAGGFTPTAQPDSVLLLRKVNEEERIAVRIDMQEHMATGSDEIRLASDDVVFVPKSSIGRWNKIVEQYVQRGIPVQLGFIAEPFFATVGGIR